MKPRHLVWFRSDLRTADNTALYEACRNSSVHAVGVFIVCGKQWQRHDWGPAKVDFVLRSVEALGDALADRGIPLRVLQVPTFKQVPQALGELARQEKCESLYFNREYEVNERARDERTTNVFQSDGLAVHTFDDQTILPPDEIRTQAGAFYTVFSPFKKSWLKRAKSEADDLSPRQRPRRRSGSTPRPDKVPDRVEGFDPSPMDPDLWPAGEKEAKRRLDRFIDRHAGDYHKDRDLPAVDGTSTLSPYLACGSISARQCLHAAMEANRGRLDGGRKGLDTWISELIWREFYRHVLVGFPRVSKHLPFKRDTDRLPWSEDRDLFQAWCDGQTGYPIVDAAMRQLNATGWMHNRLRMVSAMFLTKDLLIDWRWGERYFMQHLVDGDLASNNGGWQWSASTGTDAVPYFRIFNPTSQSERFDKDGSFIRQWCPELAELDHKAVHDPSRLPPLVCSSLDYPEPIVDHAKARQRTLAAFKKLSARH
ncbi:MAG: deoxyribodipyrimidine photo-lyase [Phycisphaerae bacterium]|nr:deoxyribodipyrimidine photo-lyase [Phycisphaerae bacterium]